MADSAQKTNHGIESVQCKYCPSTSCSVDYQLSWHDERFSDYQVVCCADCQIAFMQPFPDDATLEELYNSIQYQDIDRKGGNPIGESDDHIANQIARERHFFERYQRWLPDAGTVLDVGSGWGFLIKQFQNKGWQPHGLEVSSMQAEFASTRLGLNIHRSAVEQVDTIDFPATFDLVVMRHTLEHFRDPQSVLTKLRKLSSPCSTLIIEVPDYQSYDRRKYGKAWPAFGPWHLWYFSQPSLTRLLIDAGYSPVAFQHNLSDRIFGNKQSRSQRVFRRIANRLNAKRLFSGRNIAVVARRSD